MKVFIVLKFEEGHETRILDVYASLNSAKQRTLRELMRVSPKITYGIITKSIKELHDVKFRFDEQGKRQLIAKSGT